MHRDPMVPAQNWRQDVADFTRGRDATTQFLLCYVCVTREGLLEAPDEVVVVAGQSYCLRHLSERK